MYFECHVLGARNESNLSYSAEFHRTIGLFRSMFDASSSGSELYFTKSKSKIDPVSSWTTFTQSVKPIWVQSEGQKFTLVSFYDFDNRRSMLLKGQKLPRTWQRRFHLLSVEILSWTLFSATFFKVKLCTDDHHLLRCTSFSSLLAHCGWRQFHRDQSVETCTLYQISINFIVHAER